MQSTKKTELTMFSKKTLRALIIPLMIEQTLALTVGLIDTVMVATIGEDAVSGVSLVETINVLLINVFAALATGGAVVAGQYLGSRNKKSSRHAAKQLVLVTFLCALVIMVICLLLNRQILSLIFGNTDAAVMNHAITYFYITAISYPFIALFNSSAALFRSMGNSRAAMINALIMNLLNITGNYIFIFVLDLGVLGAALSTLLSRIIASFTMMYMLRNPNLDIHIRSYRLNDFDPRMIRRIFRVGIPNGLENSVFQLGKILLASLVALHGTTAIAANAVANSIAMIEIIPGFAMALAITTVVSRCIGAKEYEQADGYIRYLMKLAYLFMFILNIIMLFLLRPILGLYNLSADTYDTALQLMTLHGVFAILIWPMSFSLPSAFRAAGDARFTMMVSMISMICFRIVLSYVLAYGFGLGVLSVWIAMMVDWCFRSLCFMLRLRSGKWKHAALI